MNEELESAMGSEDCSRVDDFEEGIAAMEAKEYDSAIEKFQACMKKLSNQGLGLNSELFPKCLQNISACYNEKDEMDKALSFKKFEKLFYETVLLHNGMNGLSMNDLEENDQSIRDRGDGSSEASAESVSDVNSNSSEIKINQDEDATSENQTVKRAFEYNQLAQLCMQQECVSLALEYSGKATLLYRHEYGDDHEVTKKSFDLFTSIYAEAGKKQYSDSIEQLDLDSLSNMESLSASSSEETVLRRRKNTESTGDSEGNKPLKRTRSILKRGTSESKSVNSDLPTPETQRRVTFADPLPQMVRLRDDDETDDSSTNILLFFLVCILIILISLLVSALVCQMQPTMAACVEFKREFTHYYHKLRYFYSSYFRK